VGVISDPVFLLVAVAAVSAMGLSKGGFSGLGLVSAPLLSLVMPPLQALGILLPILLAQDVVSVWAFRRTWSAWNLAVMLPGQLVGMGVAWVVAAHVDDAYVRLTIGIITLAFALNHWLGRRPAAGEYRPSAASGAVWGGVSGFTSFLANSGSPPFQMHVLPQRLDRETFVGTLTIFFAIGNAMKVVPFFFLGQLSPANMTTALALLPIAVLSNLAGVWLVRRTSNEVFYRLMYMLIFLVSLELIRNGVAGLL
jgi:uncharacterized membrane protein YfcA